MCEMATTRVGTRFARVRTVCHVTRQRVTGYKPTFAVRCERRRIANLSERRIALMVGNALNQQNERAGFPGEPEPPTPSPFFLVSLCIGGSFALSRMMNPSATVVVQPPSHTETTSRVVSLTQNHEHEDFSRGVSGMPFPTCDIGSLAGLVPRNWGLPYHGTNPGIALIMASAGVTLRMMVNVSIMYFICKYWLV